MRRSENPNRYLELRARGGWRYVRRVPTQIFQELQKYNPGYPEWIKRSLKTHDQLIARAKRDVMEKADDDYWTQAIANGLPEQEAYEKAITRARTLKIEYRLADDIAKNVSVDEILERISNIAGPHDRVTADAVLGGAPTPKHTLDQAFDTFEKEIRKQELAKKSPHQRRKWRELKQRGLSNFKREIGNIAIEDITREKALQFHKFWLARIAPEDEDEEPTHSASAGNKDMDTMRSLCGEFFDHLGREDLANPFRGLRFTDDEQNSRPAFSEKWIKDKILKEGALDGLNDEARNAVLILINTGARPSEITNLQAGAIFVDADIPHIDIKPVTKGTDKRALKNRATLRRIPLVGHSLEAMKKFPNGFPAYRDNDNLSATVNKFFRENSLMESDKHTLYSLRHGFEARLKHSKTDEELRRYLMGHSIKRPKYGYSEDLSWSLAAIEKVAL